MPQTDTLSKAKAQLILDHPFFASLLLALSMHEDKSIPTMATNGDWIKYNPDWVATLTLHEVVFVLAHEAMHCAMQHMDRRNSRHQMKWNIACDYAINQVLFDDRVGKMPKGGLLDSKIYQQGNGTAEGIFKLLPEPEPQPQSGKGNGQSGQGDGIPGPGEPGGPLDDVQDSSDDPAERASKEAQRKVDIEKAKNAAKACGKLSQGLKRLIDEALKPKVDWRSVLRNFFTQRAKIEYTFAKPKRRFLADDLLLPSLTGESLGPIVVAIDCSGSIGPRELSAFAAEIKSIVEETHPAECHVVYFDSEVCHHDTFLPDDELHIEPHGGGGTAFSPIFRYIEKQAIEPVACVVLTDLECDDFGQEPGYPVLWATTHREDAPWGAVVRLREDDLE